MPIRFKRSLRFRGGLAFALFGCLLSLLLSGWLYLASHEASLRLMDETLKAELEDYFTRRQRNPDSLPAATVTVVGYVSPSLQGAPPPPEKLSKTKPGLSTIVTQWPPLSPAGPGRGWISLLPALQQNPPAGT